MWSWPAGPEVMDSRLFILNIIRTWTGLDNLATTMLGSKRLNAHRHDFYARRVPKWEISFSYKHNSKTIRNITVVALVLLRRLLIPPKSNQKCRLSSYLPLRFCKTPNEYSFNFQKDIGTFENLCIQHSDLAIVDVFRKQACNEIVTSFFSF